MKRTFGVTLGAVVAATLVVSLVRVAGRPAGEARGAHAQVVAHSDAGQAALSELTVPTESTAASAAMPLDAVGAAIAFSSLRGSAADGDWGIDASGRFRPSRQLRRRFDYYLALQGEIPLDALQRWIDAQVRQLHGAAAAGQVMQVFASYLRLQQHPWRTEADPRRPETLGTALAERIQVRREMLGMEVAQAFYREEDAALEALIAQANSGASAPKAPAIDGIQRNVGSPPPLPDAAARLADLQIRWDDWEGRIAAARTEIARLRAAAELSAPQRDAAIDSWVIQRFDAAEQRRARALLQLPST